MRACLLVPVLAAVFAVGCSRPTAAPPAADPAPAPPGTMFDTPEYANWAKFPVGSVVKRRAVTTTEKSSSTVTSVSTYTLRSVAPDSAEVVRDVTTTRDSDPPMVNTGDVQRVRRQFALPAGMTADDFRKPSRNAKKVGEESVEVLGKKYPAAVYEWTDSTEAGPLQIKLWLSAEMPGRVVKQTMYQPNITNRTVEEVIEIKLP